MAVCCFCCWKCDHRCPKLGRLFVLAMLVLLMVLVLMLVLMLLWMLVLMAWGRLIQPVKFLYPAAAVVAVVEATFCVTLQVRIFFGLDQ